MGFGVSLILIAVGLILALAVNMDSSAVDIHTNTWAGPGYWSSRRRTTYVDEGPPTY